MFFRNPRQLLATALAGGAALLAGAAPASAAVSTIGPADLTTAVMPFGTDDETFVNQTVPYGSVPSIARDGRIVTWRANVLSTGPIRLAVVHPAGTPGQYTVTAIDDQVASGTGVQQFTPSTPLEIAAGDTIALVQHAGGATPRYADDPSSTFWVKSGAISPMTPTTGQTFQAPVNVGGAVLFNADVDDEEKEPTLTGAGAFAKTTVGERSEVSTFQLLNENAWPLMVDANGVTLTGDDAADFEIDADTCSGATLPPAATCAVQVAFKPSVAGARAANLRIATGSPNSPTTLALSGLGAAPEVEAPVLTPVEPPAETPVHTPADPPAETPVLAPAPKQDAPATAPALRATIGAAVTVAGKPVAVGCSVTGATLRSCGVELYAHAPAGKKRVLVGTGERRADAGASAMDVVVTLTTAGRELLRRFPGGLDVSAQLLGTPVTGAPLHAKAVVRLLPRRAATVLGGFPTHRATLTTKVERRLNALAGQLATAKTVRCVGHTAGGRDSAALRALGLRRAQAVCAALQREGVTARFVVSSQGATIHSASDRTAAGRAANRRVEVRITR